MDNYIPSMVDVITYVHDKTYRKIAYCGCTDDSSMRTCSKYSPAGGSNTDYCLFEISADKSPIRDEVIEELIAADIPLCNYMDLRNVATS